MQQKLNKFIAQPILASFCDLELRDELKLTYNKARQASITNEILEIVGGARH